MTLAPEIQEILDKCPDSFPITKVALKGLLTSAYEVGYVDGAAEQHKVHVEMLDKITQDTNS